MEEVFSKAVVALSSIETEGESGWCSIVKIFIYMIKKWKYDDKEQRTVEKVLVEKVVEGE